MSGPYQEKAHIRYDYASTLVAAMRNNCIEAVAVGPVVSMLLPVTKSLIVRKNKGVAHCFRLDGLKGLFRKDAADTAAFGRYYCDLIKRDFSCQGFFTTDELPKYGLGVDHGDYIAYHTGSRSPYDVTVVTLYTRSLAERIRRRLASELEMLLNKSSHNGTLREE